MTVQQQVLQLSEYGSLYDLIVPKENSLRKINDLIDFNFIYEELQAKYSQAQGCVAECPIKIFIIKSDLYYFQLLMYFEKDQNNFRRLEG